MLKMFKYEYRKNLPGLIGVIIAIGILEAFLLIAIGAKSEEYAALGMGLFFILSFACYIFVLIYGAMAYSGDLKKKSGYLVFMAPVSSFSVLGAKLLSTLFTGVILVFVLGLCGALDYTFAVKQFELENGIDAIKQIFGMMGLDATTVVFAILMYILVFLINFFMIVTVAYLAISISATILQEKKSKGFVSIVLFIALFVVISIVSGKLPHIGNLREINTLTDSLVYSLPSIIFEAFCMVGCYIGSSLLLDKKISL